MVWISCEVDDVDWISVSPTPISLSLNILLIVSLVKFLRTSLTTTSPISEETAKDFVSSGSAFGLSRLICGKSSLTGCENFSAVNGAILGAFDAFVRVK